MPRPGSATNSNRTKDNSLVAWWKNRKERKKLEAEEAAAKIIDNAVKNENTFCTVLQGIHFNKSKLPAEKLEHKSKPNQPCGDLELAARWLEQELRRNTLPVTMDVSPLDRNLYQIILRFKEAVEQGYTKEAFAARAALISTFTNIRFRLPQVLPQDGAEEYAREYIKVCADHVEGWLNLMTQARIADNFAADLERQEKELDKKNKKHETNLDKFMEYVENDPERNAAFLTLAKGDVPFSELSPMARKLRAESIELDIDRVVLSVAEKCVQQTRIQLTQAEGRMDMLQVGLAAIKIPVDPNAMNKYQDEIKKIMEGMAKQDQEIEESIKYFEDIRGQVKAMDDLPGEIAVREATARSIEETMGELKKRQDAKLAGPQAAISIMELYGLKSKEEMEQALAEQEILMQEILAQQEQEQEETEGELNYNS